MGAERPYIDELQRKLNKNYPKGRIYFITIKDNTKSTKWMTIGKVNDWIRRYSKSYYIVKGTNGGIHYHLIAGITKGKTPIPHKGIHFNMKTLKQPTLPICDTVIREIQEDKYKAETITEANCEKLNCPEIAVRIAQMIKQYYRKVLTRKNDTTCRKNKEKNIENIFLYLQKNLEEPRENPQATTHKYTDYILQI